MDPEFSFLLKVDPAFEQWRQLAAEWFALWPLNRTLRQRALTRFFVEFMHANGIDKTPIVIFDASRSLPPLAFENTNESSAGSLRDLICDFLDWVLEEKMALASTVGGLEAGANLRNPVVRRRRRQNYVRSPRIANAYDDDFRFLLEYDNNLEAWRNLAAEYWLVTGRSATVRRALAEFLVGYLHGQGLPTAPIEFLKVGRSPFPDLREHLGKVKSVQTTSALHAKIFDFVQWVVVDKQGFVTGTESNAAPSLQYALVNPLRRSRRVRTPVAGAALDSAFQFLRDVSIELENWGELAAEWLASVSASRPEKTRAIGRFLRWYIHEHQLYEPIAIFQADRTLPPFAERRGGGKFEGDHGPERDIVHVHDFLAWIFTQKLSVKDTNGITTTPTGLRIPFARAMKKKSNKSSDAEFHHVCFTDPSMDPWRALAAEYMKSARRARPKFLEALDKFLDGYILKGALERNPVTFLLRTTPKPRFWDYLQSRQRNSQSNGAVRLHTKHDVNLNNCASSFLQWVLESKLSAPDDHGASLIPSEFHNPIDGVTSAGTSIAESVRQPLPYRYVKEARDLLCGGDTFRSWHWAHQALGDERHSGDWFVVESSVPDPNDPNCVWRIRDTNAAERRSGLPDQVTELWSPVRSVALYLKLELPLRTFQVRMLDSGEADTWRYERGRFSRNAGPLATGSEKRPFQRGVFHRSIGEIEAGLYINTNKTADVEKDEASKGYVIPWSHGPVLYWLEALRNWQERYNPLAAPTPWRELGRTVFGRIPPHIDVLEERGTACFLFRDARQRIAKGRCHPITNNLVAKLWHRLLEHLEDRCFHRGETLDDGTRIRFVREDGIGSHYPLHALRVSLISAYVLEGGLPIQIVSKLIAGHARIIMTLYYTKIGRAYMNEVMAEAERRMLASEAENHKRFLQGKGYEEISRRFAFLKPDAVMACEHSSSTGGFVIEDKGICPVGGAMCDIGGEELSNSKDSNYFAPVAGYPQQRNCVRCRFFLTGPAFLPGLQARFNQLSYEAHECAARYNKLGDDLAALENRRAVSESKSQIFAEGRELERISQRYEAEAEQMSQLVNDIQACHRLIARCIEIARESDASGVRLVGAGMVTDIQYALTEATSEFHQLEVLCESAVVYPEIDARKPTLRRSQLLDCMLELNGKPPVFFRLSETQQLEVGNAVMSLIQARAGSMSDAVEFAEGTRQLRELGLLEETWGVIANSVAALPGSSVVAAVKSRRKLAPIS